jgi:hypothetical protein
MTVYRYRIYYEWSGPSASDMFANEKSAEDLDWAFDRFPTELEHRLDDLDALAELQRADGQKDGILTVSTSTSEEQFKKALVATLQDWRLFGTKLE